MKRLSATQRVLGGALLALVAFWLFDHFTGRSRPAAAQGKPARTEMASGKSVAWPDLSDRVAHLTRPAYASVATELNQVARDLFIPVPAAQQALAASVPHDETPPPPEEPAPPKPSFESRHKLAGVIIGHNSLAVIDDRLFGIGAVLDGYRLVEVHRDFVRLCDTDTGKLVTLTLQQRPGNP
jgi:hypothetical protein